jgi:hypothetical protein
MVFKLFPASGQSLRRKAKSVVRRNKHPVQLPLPDLPSAAEYRARIAKAALSGFQTGDDLVSIGLDSPSGHLASSTPAEPGQD